MATPQMASAAVQAARSLTDDALAQRVTNIQQNPRWGGKAIQDATLEEAARRLRWGRMAEKQEQARREDEQS